MNNFITGDASVIKERVARGGLAGMGDRLGICRVTRGAHIECI
jgi:hypothetical protein